MLLEKESKEKNQIISIKIIYLTREILVLRFQLDVWVTMSIKQMEINV